MTIYIDKQRQSNPEVFKRKTKVVYPDGEVDYPELSGVKDGDIILIPAEYNEIDETHKEYGYICRKGAYYYAISKSGKVFVKDAAGIESFGKKGVLVYERATRENPEQIPWIP